MKLFKACIAMAAFAALFVVPSMASASPELCETTGEPLTCHTVPAGTNIVATNVEHSASGITTTTKMTTGLGNIECETATLTGALETNSGTHIAGNITTAEFKGTPGNPTTTDCLGPGGSSVTVTPSHTNAGPEHEVTGSGVKSVSLPWCVTANELNDKFTVRGGKCSEAPRALFFTLHSSVCGTATFAKASVTGEYTTHSSGDAVLWIKEEEFKRVTSGAFCPASGKLDMAFTLTTDTKPNHSENTPLFVT